MTEDERAIRQVVESWMEASKTGDAATVLTLMTDDAVFMVPGREPFGRQVFEAAAKIQNDSKITGSNKILEVEVLGGWAFTRSYIDVTITPKTGLPVRRSGYTLTIFRKEPDGKWRLARDANLLVARS